MTLTLMQSDGRCEHEATTLARTHLRRCFMDLLRSSTPSLALLKASTTCFMRAFSSAVARLAFASLACATRARSQVRLIRDHVECLGSERGSGSD